MTAVISSRIHELPIEAGYAGADDGAGLPVVLTPGFLNFHGDLVRPHAEDLAVPCGDAEIVAEEIAFRLEGLGIEGVIGEGLSLVDGAGEGDGGGAVVVAAVVEN